MNWIINHTYDLTQGHPQPRVFLDALCEVGDINSHTWNVRLTNSGQPVDLTNATVKGKFLLPDGTTVPVNGTASGNTVTVIPTRYCFAQEGYTTGIVQVSHGGSTFTVDGGVFIVRKDDSGTYVDPGEVIPTPQEVYNLISRCESATDAATAATAQLTTLLGSAIVRYDISQSLTTAQKTQVRSNIGLTFTDDGQGNITVS